MKNLAELGPLTVFFYHITSSDIVRWYCISKYVSVKSLCLTKSPVLEGAFPFPSGLLQCIQKHEIGRKKYAIADPTIALILQKSALIQLCSFYYIN